MPRYGHTFGIGAATDTGPRVRYGFQDRRINRSGHRFEGRIEVSAIGSNFGGRTALLHLATFAIDAASESETTDNVETTRLVTGLRHTVKRQSWLETAFIELQRESFTVGDEEDVTNLLVPGITWTRSRSDEPSRPQRGYRIGIELRGASSEVFSDLSFAQLVLRGKRVYSLLWGARLLLRAEAGVTELGRFEELPASLRFFAGGDNSVRGYAYESLGPTDADGEVIGGRHLLVGSAEVDFPLTERWSIAGFIDEGNAIDKANDDLFTGVGAGLRWHSPIGPIRFDLAHPLDDPDTDLRFHLSMGLDL